LFLYTTYNGVTPSDVFDACLNLAHSPAITTANSGFFGLAVKNSPFRGSLSTAPNDWTISIKYSAPNTSYPARPAIDFSGDVWIPNVGNSSLTELSPTGVVLSGTSGFTGGAMAAPTTVAIDTSVANGYVWVGNFDNGTVAKFNLSGTPASTTGYAACTGFSYQAVMKGSNTNGTVSVFATGTKSSGTAGTALSGSTGYTTPSTTSYHATPSATFLGIAPTYGIVGLAIDPSGNLWATDVDGSLYEFVGLAAPVSPQARKGWQEAALGHEA
jgi:hypothetical protein